MFESDSSCMSQRAWLYHWSLRTILDRPTDVPSGCSRRQGRRTGTGTSRRYMQLRAFHTVGSTATVCNVQRPANAATEAIAPVIHGVRSKLAVKEITALSPCSARKILAVIKIVWRTARMREVITSPVSMHGALDSGSHSQFRQTGARRPAMLGELPVLSVRDRDVFDVVPDRSQRTGRAGGARGYKPVSRDSTSPATINRPPSPRSTSPPSCT